MRTRKQVVVSIDENVLIKIKKIKEELGIPISRQLELSWIKTEGKI